MELKIKPFKRNTYPLKGILIKGNNIGEWIKELQHMQITLSEASVFPIPGTEPNSVWGCLVVPECFDDNIDVRHNSLCQLVNKILFIPEYSTIYPVLTNEELPKLLQSKLHILHPEFGFCELEEKIDWSDYILLPSTIESGAQKPKESIFIPQKIKSFQIIPVSKEEILTQLEQVADKQPKKFEDEPLGTREQVKLAFYKRVFGKIESEGEQSFVHVPEFVQKLSFLDKFLSKGSKPMQERLLDDYESIQKRSESHLEKLMKLLKENPEEALQYAVPMDGEGTNRGGNLSSFDLTKRNYDFSSIASLLRNKRSGEGGGNFTATDDSFFKLRTQYYDTARQLIEKKEYMKASFVYIKLLKDNQAAATALENGFMYQEAAVVYHDLLKNTLKAAECYEKGNMYSQAIELYEENGMYEKVGDVYTKLQKSKDANVYYEKVVDEYSKSHQYVKASLVYRNKIKEPLKGQTLLMEGWRKNYDAYNCLNNYFSNISEIKDKRKEIDRMYKNEVTENNREGFLQVIKHEYVKENELAQPIKDMAYEIITELIPKNKYIVSELLTFNQTNKQLAKDTLRYKTGKNKS